MGSSAANTNGRIWERGRAHKGNAETGAPAPASGGTTPSTTRPNPSSTTSTTATPPTELRDGRSGPRGVAVIPRDGEAPLLVPDGGAPEQARAGLAGTMECRPADACSSREAGERLRRTHHTEGGSDAPLVTPVLEQLEVNLPAGLGRGQEFVHAPLYLGLKRAMDVVLAGIMLVMLAPLFALIALAIKLEDRGPVFFYQTRVGKNGRPFRFWKFRSMIVDAEARRAALKAQAQAEAVSDRLRFKMSADPRVTRVGRVLRRFSLDELPQLFNVLAGDMSLVGPRPPIPEEVEQYSPRHMRRLEVEQGITCLWQVSGRNLLSFEQQVELDIEYARRRSLALDVLLLARTVPAVLSGRGAC